MLVAHLSLSETVNNAEYSLVVEIAGKTFQADVGAEYHVYYHAVVSHGDAFSWKAASNGMFRNVQKISGKGKVLFRVRFIVIAISAGIGKNLMRAGRKREIETFAGFVVMPFSFVGTQSMGYWKITNTDALNDNKNDFPASDIFIYQFSDSGN